MIINWVNVAGNYEEISNRVKKIVAEISTLSGYENIPDDQLDKHNHSC